MTISISASGHIPKMAWAIDPEGAVGWLAAVPDFVWTVDGTVLADAVGAAVGAGTAAGAAAGAAAELNAGLAVAIAGWFAAIADDALASSAIIRHSEPKKLATTLGFMK
ncbi:MAG: hypothetical protein ACP5VQ_04960 [Phycisphaerae bacterium]